MARAVLARRRAGQAEHAAADAEPGRRAGWTPLAVEAVRPRRLYAQIAEQIEALLRQQNLKTGDRLPPEKVLARALGISRLSLREAMIALESAGLIDVRVGSGTYVRTIMPAGYRFPWSRHDDPGPGVREQFVARKLVEPELAALAALDATTEEIATLTAAVDRAERQFTAGHAADDEDYAFHVGLAEASHNSVLAAFVRQLWDMRRHQMWHTLRGRVVKPEHRLEVIEDRRAVLAALRRRDAKAARGAIKRFLARAERRYFD
jgi:DNA-binding FadR family transcriptional regulator